MTIYTVEELQAQGIQPDTIKTRLRIRCVSGTFIRDRDFPKRFMDTAQKIMDNYIKSGIKSFIVETSLYVTVWKEEKKRDEVPRPSPPVMSAPRPDASAGTSRSTETPATIEPVPRRKLVRKYRGNEYTIGG